MSLKLVLEYRGLDKPVPFLSAPERNSVDLQEDEDEAKKRSLMHFLGIVWCWGFLHCFAQMIDIV